MPRSLADRRKQAELIHRRLKSIHADATIELIYSNPIELLIATILSAQCTDKKVNEVTAVLFREFRSPTDYLKRSITDLEAIIRPTGFYRNKAKNIRGAMERLVAEYKGQVPATMEELVTLPGVGRKTANVVLGNAFGLEGLPVDTHVTRLSQRLGLTKSTDAVEIERELCALLPPEEWCQFSHELIFHGRRVCKAQRPLCESCGLSDICPSRHSLSAARRSLTVQKSSRQKGSVQKGASRVRRSISAT